MQPDTISELITSELNALLMASVDDIPESERSMIKDSIKLKQEMMHAYNGKQYYLDNCGEYTDFDEEYNLPAGSYYCMRCDQPECNKRVHKKDWRVR